MNINYFKAVEADISSLPKLRRSLDFLRRKQKRIIESNAPSVPGAIDYSKAYTDSHFVNDTLNEVLELSQTRQAISSTTRHIEEIEEILNALTDEQRAVLTLFYIDRIPSKEIARQIFVESEKTVYNLRNKAIAEYALIAYGAEAKALTAGM